MTVQLPPSVRCRSCPTQVVWATTSNGKRIPINAEPVESGSLLLEHRDGQLLATVSAGGTHVAHFATCPSAESWRRR